MREEQLQREIEQDQLMKQMMETMLQHHNKQTMAGSHPCQQMMNGQTSDAIYNINKPRSPPPNGSNDIRQQIVLEGLKELEVS